MTLTNKFNKKAALYCQKENEFDKSDLSSRYEFDWMDDYGDYFTSNFLNPYTDLFYGKPIPVSRSAWANTSIWVTFSDSWRDFEAKFRLEYTLKDAYSLADVISTMLKEIDPRLKHEGTSEYSQFLYSGTSPLSFDTARNGYKVYIAPKSNVLKGNYDQAAQKAELSFEQLMDMLRNCFRCYWFIDEYNRFRIEHISYFLKGMSYTNPTSQFNLTQELDKISLIKKQHYIAKKKMSLINLICHQDMNLTGWMIVLMLLVITQLM